MPWPAAKARLYETIFPQMVRWLPDAEAAALREAFETEVARLAKATTRRRQLNLSIGRQAGQALSAFGGAARPTYRASSFDIAVAMCAPFWCA